MCQPCCQLSPPFPQAQGSCQSELHRALERLAASQTRTHEDLYVIPIPNCDRNGNFHPKQVGRALAHHRGPGGGRSPGGILQSQGEAGRGTRTDGPVLGHGRAHPRLLASVGIALQVLWDPLQKPRGGMGVAPARAPGRPSQAACGDGTVGARLGAPH